MSPDEIKHRFRFVALGYVVLAIATAAALAFNFSQENEIKANEQQIKTGAERLSTLLAVSGYEICIALDKRPDGGAACQAIRNSADTIFYQLTK